MFDIKQREEIARLRVQEHRSVGSLMEEYGVSAASISRWSKQYQKGIIGDAVIVDEQLQRLEAENKDLKEEVARLTDQNDIFEKENMRLKTENEVLRGLMKEIFNTGSKGKK